MGERGFGSPEVIGTTDPDPGKYDAGFGSPFPSEFSADQYDTGFGSPLDELVVESVQLALESGVPWLPDDGGVMVTLLAVWPTKGPLKIRLRGQTGVPFPVEGGFCHSGKVGQGTDIYVADDTAVDELRFAMPPVPAGLYDVEVLWGLNQGESATATQLLEVVFRNRSIPTYRVRSRLPSQWARGPIRPRSDEAP